MVAFVKKSNLATALLLLLLLATADIIPARRPAFVSSRASKSPSAPSSKRSASSSLLYHEHGKHTPPRRRRAMGTGRPSPPSSPSPSSLGMGLLDSFKDAFLSSRDEGDFARLDNADPDTFGPGPLILLYAVPATMDDAELLDMVDDGMPSRGASDGGVVVRRLAGMDADGEGGDALLDATVEEALDEAMKDGRSGGSVSTTSAPEPAATTSAPVEATTAAPCPVLYFSGTTNSEMMDTYNIVANEIYAETAGAHWPACAKVVPPAMEKSLRRVLGEISEDHADAMRMRKEGGGGGD